jgi:hypothetical protein
MRATTDAAATVRALIAAIPEQCLRDLCLQLAINSLATPPLATPAAETQTRRRRGRPRGTASKKPARRSVDPKLAARRKRYQDKRAAARRAAKAADAAKAPQPTPANGNGEDAPITAQAFWQRCEQMEPAAPWRIPVREFGVRDAVAQQAFRARTLPPRMGPMAISRFLELQPG